MLSTGLEPVQRGQPPWLWEDSADVARGRTNPEQSPLTPGVGSVPGRLPARWSSASALPLLAVAIPLVLFGWVALRQPLTFDGGMNLQVARRMATDWEYARYYDELRFFPHEVQTNGPFIFVAALWTLLLGTGQLGLQAANLAFVAGMALVIWRVFRHWPGPAVVAPTLALMMLPLAFSVGIGGQGEIPALFFLLLSLSLLFDALLVEDDGRALVLMSTGFVSIGLGVTTKTVILGGLPAVAGLAVAITLVRSLPVRRSLVRTPLVALPVIAFEIFRMVQLGSPSAWWDWWSEQSEKIAFQSGLDREPATRLVLSPFDRLHILSEQISLPAELIVLWAVAVAAISVGLLVHMLRNRRESFLLKAVAIPAAALSGVMVTYFAWFLLVLPARKVVQPVLGTRRILPALLTGNLALLLLICGCAVMLWRYRRGREADPALSTLARLALTASAAALVLVGTAFAVGSLPDRIRGVVESDDRELTELRAAVDWMGRRPEGTRYYGEGWWSAPVLSLMSDRPFDSTTTIDDWCDLDPERDFVVWDEAAQRIAGPGPTRLGGDATATLVADLGAVRFFSLAPTDQGCPAVSTAGG